MEQYRLNNLVGIYFTSVKQYLDLKKFLDQDASFAR